MIEFNWEGWLWPEVIAYASNPNHSEENNDNIELEVRNWTISLVLIHPGFWISVKPMRITPECFRSRRYCLAEGWYRTAYNIFSLRMGFVLKRISKRSSWCCSILIRKLWQGLIFYPGILARKYYTERSMRPDWKIESERMLWVCQDFKDLSDLVWWWKENALSCAHKAIDFVLREEGQSKHDANARKCE